MFGFVKVLLLAGEESGVLYAKGIADELRGKNAAAEVRGYGDYGFEVSDLAVMGILAVLKRLCYFLRVKRTMVRAIDEWKPDVVCTVDYPGMNLKLAAYAKSKGIRTVHVVCPQVWAWKRGRIPKIEASVGRLCCFFPFEPQYFTPGFAVFVGHPLVGMGKANGTDGTAGTNGTDAADRTGERNGSRKLVALLPGSRIAEIERNLPVLMETLSLLGEVEAVVPAANDRAFAAIQRICANRVAVIKGGARALLARADVAAVASGTATLEAALARCPTVLVYRVGPLLYCLGKLLIRGVKHLGLANIIAEKGGFECPMPELIQGDFTPEKTAACLKLWLEDPAARAAAVARLDAVLAALGTGEGAFRRIVAEILP